VETSAWDAASSGCRLLDRWPKRLHLVGATGYSGAYRQHRAAVWGKLLPNVPDAVEEIQVKSLLKTGTFYFWGLYKAK
jgi:hypothetical protein